MNELTKLDICKAMLRSATFVRNNPQDFSIAEGVMALQAAMMCLTGCNIENLITREEGFAIIQASIEIVMMADYTEEAFIKDNLVIEENLQIMFATD